MYVYFHTISPMRRDLEWFDPLDANSSKVGSLINYGQSVRRNIDMWCCCSWIIFKNIYLRVFVSRWWKCLALVLCLPFWLQCVQSVFNSWTQMCLNNNNMCMGFNNHILIGHLGSYEKRNATLFLYSLHLRLVVDSMLRVKTQLID